MYKPNANAVANVTGTLKEFFYDYPDFIDWIAEYEPLFTGFDYPLINNFIDLEDWDIDNELSSIAIDNKLIHGEFVEGLSGERSEGLFAGTLTNGISYYAEGADLGYYTVYNLNGITAPYGMLGEYEDVLRTASSRISDNFILLPVFFAVIIAR